jgi:integrase
MTKRRGRGDGSIRERIDGRWEGRLELSCGPTGNRRQKSVFGRTRREVVAKMRAEQQRLDSGLPPTDGRRRVRDFLQWWSEKVLPGTVSAGSEATYRRWLRLYVIPSVGNLRLTELAPAHVTEMMRSMEAGELSRGRPLSPQTQSSARKVLARALRRAEQEGLVARNAAMLADGPRVPRREGRSLTGAQARELLVAIEEHRLGPAFGVQLALGLRLGEVLGLRWRDIELECSPAIVHVRQQLQRVAGAGLTLVELKTAQSRRDLVLPAPMAVALRRHRVLQSTERLAAGPAWQDELGLVFTTPIGTPVDPDNFRHRLSELTTACGLGHWTTHELRHSAGSLLFAAGVPMKLISEMLGHSSERVTSDVYVHTEQAARDRVAEAMAGVLFASADQTGAIEGQFVGQLTSETTSSVL